MAKLYAHWITVNYRESYDLFATSGICSTTARPAAAWSSWSARSATAWPASRPAWPPSYASATSTPAATGQRADYVEAMWRMLQLDEPGDFVVASGETHSIRELCEVAFSHAGLDWEQYVVQDPQFYRPAEVDLLIGDAARLRSWAGSPGRASRTWCGPWSTPTWPPGVS